MVHLPTLPTSHMLQRFVPLTLTMSADPRESIHAALSGDAPAFDSLFGRNLPKLMAYIRLRMGRHLTGKESVSDIAQSVCREVLQDMDDFEYQGEEAFRKWLMMQATRKLLDRHRYYTRQQRDVAREVPAQHLHNDDDDTTSMVDCYATFCTPSRAPTAKDELERIEGALHELPENQREAVALSKLMGVPNTEIAEQLGCTPGAVRALIARGLAGLAIILGEP